MDEFKKDLAKAFAISSIIYGLTGDLNEATFEAIICSMIDEWCRSHEYDIIEFTDKISDLIHDVNKNK